MGKWIDSLEANSPEIPANAKDFHDFTKSVDPKNKPDHVDWLKFLTQSGIADGKPLMDEARKVARSLGHSAIDQERLCDPIQQLVTEIQSGKGTPAIETVVRVYDALCLLDKEGKER